MYQMHPHAWALYFDFLHEFRTLTYRGVAIGLFCHFPYYIGRMASKIEQPAFKQHLRHQPSREQIQPNFEQFLPHPDPATSLKAQNKKVLFLGGTYLHPLDPSRVLVLRTDDCASYRGLPTCNLQSYQSDVSTLIQEIQSRAQNIFQKLDDHPVFGVPMFSRKLIEQDIPTIIPWLVAVFDLLEQVPVAGVVVEGANATAKVSCILPTVAAMKGIPSLCLQHGIIGADRGWLPLYTTEQAVYGFYEKKFFQDAGVPEDRLEIAGHPRFDAIFERRHMNKADFCTKYQINPRKKWALIFTQPIWELTHLSNLVRHLLRYSLGVMIKLHPAEIRNDHWKERYKPLIERYPSVRWFTTECHLYNLMANADAAVSMNSTTGLEQLLMDKPVVYMGKGTGAPYRYSPQLTNPDPKIAATLVQRLIVDQSFRVFARRKRVRYLAKAYPVRQSKEKVFQLIERLTGINPHATSFH
ncbi:capsular polysaccharide export protein, LipB/KpsS family [Desmospora profundinema]|uniref:Uncharacterized protein n=1 Tax=Desmospora profundinema TaxID=1571184 RepID=A0ABU1IHT3_9BACL|nr:hypothetical protein [Desmospora profundinema]MDR6224326.1 hypothetical protein [Desmospora profundinema]